MIIQERLQEDLLNLEGFAIFGTVFALFLAALPSGTYRSTVTA